MKVKNLTLSSFGAIAFAYALVPPHAPAQESFQVRGAPDAPVELTVYSDFECPYCRNFALAAMPGLIAEFADLGLIKLRLIYFPLAGIHHNAVASAKAAHCAGRADRFWTYHDYLFVRQPEWSGDPAPESLWVGYAENLGIDTEAFADCFKSAETLAVIEANLREALDAGATGTPTVVLNGRVVTGLGSYAGLRDKIWAAIEAAKKRAASDSQR